MAPTYAVIIGGIPCCRQYGHSILLAHWRYYRLHPLEIGDCKYDAKEVMCTVLSVLAPFRYGGEEVWMQVEDRHSSARRYLVIWSDVACRTSALCRDL